MCRVRICAGMLSRQPGASRTNGDRALRGESAGRISSGSLVGRRSHEQRGHNPSNQLPNDHAARATLGRQRRLRRPGLMDRYWYGAKNRLNTKSSCGRDARTTMAAQKAGIDASAVSSCLRRMMSLRLCGGSSSCRFHQPEGPFSAVIPGNRAVEVSGREVWPR